MPAIPLASALLANGVKLVGRSFKYHRPRGILTAGSEEPNALIELRTGARREAEHASNGGGVVRWTRSQQPESLAVAWRSTSARSTRLLSPIFVAGFYYKTFMWPAAFWEKSTNPSSVAPRAWGGPASEADPDTYEKAHAFCDVLIVGGGAAGLAAALTAARAGARVILCDEDFLFGGRLNGDRREIDGVGGAEWARQAVAELDSLRDVRVMRRTTVFGVYDGNTFGAVERVSDHLPMPPPHQPRQRLWKIVAKRVVLATGAIERPIVFGGNDRPGVMMASAARTYLNRLWRGCRPAPGGVHCFGRWLEHSSRSGACRRIRAGNCRYANGSLAFTDERSQEGRLSYSARRGNHRNTRRTCVDASQDTKPRRQAG